MNSKLFCEENFTHRVILFFIPVKLSSSPEFSSYSDGQYEGKVDSSCAGGFVLELLAIESMSRARRIISRKLTRLSRKLLLADGICKY